MNGRLIILNIDIIYVCRAIQDVNPRRRIREMRPLGKGYPSATPNIDQIWQSIDFLRQCVGLEADKMIVMLIFKKCTQKFQQNYP